MGRASNSLTVSDVVVTPIKLKYTASYNQCTIGNYGITVLTGVNGPVTITGSVAQTTLNYRSVKQLYYANVLTGSYLTTSSSFDVSLQSTAASGTLDSDNRYFPTQSGAQVKIVSIPTSVFGQQVSRHGFVMTSPSYSIADDGNGNLIDYQNGSVNVGNVIYPQGMVIITNSNYLNIFPSYPIVYNKSASFASSYSPKEINVLTGAYVGSGTYVSNSVVLFGGDAALFSISTPYGVVRLNTTTPGVYTTYFTGQTNAGDLCNLTSNSASVTITVTS